MITNYVAFDVETSCASTNSICSLGYVVVVNRRIVKRSELYVCPPNLKFDQINTSIHGISQEHVENAPTFDKVWEQIQDEFEGMPLVAHNASFDISRLKASLAFYGINKDFDDVYCTYQITGKKLNVVSKELGIELDHHSALSDATACAKVFDHFQNGEIAGLIGMDTVKKKQVGQKYHIKIDSEFLKPLLEGGDSDSPFYEKKVVITGVFERYKRNEIAEILRDLGADIDTSVTKRTAYLVAGHNMGPSKRKKAEDLGVKIIDENEFAQLIGD